MSLFLSIHFKNSFYEVFLPGINNRKVLIEVPCCISETEVNLPITLEVWNNTWSVVENEAIFFLKAEDRSKPLPIVAGQSISCEYRPYKERFSIIVSKSFKGYSDFKKYSLNRIQSITIGSSDDNTIIYNNRNLVSARHAILTRDANGGYSLADPNSSNGTYVNGRRISGTCQLSYGDVVSIIGLKLVYLGNFIAINHPENSPILKNLEPYTPDWEGATGNQQEGEEYYQRSPRQIEILDNETVEIESPPNPNQGHRQPLIFTVGPAMTMVIPMAAGVMFTMWSVERSGTGFASPFMFMGIITSVTAAFIGVFWALANYRYSKKVEKEGEIRRSGLYRKYLDKIRKLLRQKHIDNKELLDKKYPTTEKCLRFIKVNSRRIWERNVNHIDFLMVRLGVGEMVSPNAISIPKERFSLIDDDLADEPLNIKNEFKKLKDVPVCISLQNHHLVGVIGAESSICHNIGRIMAIQIAAYHSYTDVRMAFIYNEKYADAFAFAKWLPHTWSVDGSLRMIACDATGVGELFYNLYGVIRERLSEREFASTSDKARMLPHYVIFIADPTLVEDEAIMKYLSAPTAQMGISTVMLYEKIGRLPNNCTVIIQSDEEYSGYYSLDSSFDGFDHVTFDCVQDEQAEEFTRELSGVRVKETQLTSAVPQLLTFLDMYRTSRVEDINVERSWLENRTYESMKAMIGYRGTDMPLYLDVHEKYHGPHGLVAGTTGSGKSETLQTYILSLALSYHPYEVSFILIDYKGGGMAGSFENLPHVAGIITNLGGNQTNRALASINSEIKRRQATFNDFKVKHIDGYIELFRGGKADIPMPHLLIIADEFAELKKEQPEFVRELVSASRVGRSLGVHLILATQKPSGVVDDEIWGNSKFRLCLRVQDKQDSNEMIKRPDAAYITNPGRGYFQVGNDEIFETFQSGWSGAKYEPEAEYTGTKQGDARMINLWGKRLSIGSGKKVTSQEDNTKKQTQLEAIVLHIANVATAQNIKAINNIWLPPLPTKIALMELPEYRENVFENGQWGGTPGELCFVAGIVDDPINQCQATLRINMLSEGHMLVVASGSGGKTTFLQTFLYSLVTTYSPDQVHLYIADFGSRTMGVFGMLPHVGGVVFDSETDKADKLIAMLLKELSRRKIAFSEKGIGSMKEYAKLYDDVPFVIFAIDNFAAFNENCPKQEDNLILLSREAASYGIYLVITCTNINDVRGRIRQNMGLGIGMQLADRFEYEDVINSKTDMMAEDRIPGRGLVCCPKPLEFQTAVCVDGEDAVAVNSKLKLQFEEMASFWHGKNAPVIPQVPSDMSLDNFVNIPEIQRILDSNRYIPVGYDLGEAQPEYIDLATMFCCSISGMPRSGKTNMLKALMYMAKRKGGKCYVFDGIGKELESWSREMESDGYITNAEELFDFMQEVILPEFTRRNRGKAEFIKNGRKNLETYVESEEKIFLFINDMSGFCEVVYESERDMKGFMEQMTARGDGHMIYLIACISTNDMSGEYNTKRLLRSFIGWKEGIHLGGSIESQKVFDFEVPVLERSKKLPAGYGYMNASGVTKRVVTPLVE